MSIAKVKYIMDNFDFEKVSRAMIVNNWTWHDEKTSPTIKVLRKRAEELLMNVYDKREASSASGGFMAYKDKDGLMGLDFTVECCNTECMEVSE